MAKQMVFLKYNFIFDASDTWTNLSEFESTLADYFAEHSLEAKIIQTVSGQVGDRLMLISKVEEAPKAEESKKPTVPVVMQTKEIPRMKKGSKPMPKIADKPRNFSNKKGRKLREVFKGERKLGGLK